MVEQVAFQTVFQFLQTVGILVGVFYYIMTIRTNQRNQEIALKNQELTLQSLELTRQAQELTRQAQEQALETRQAQLFMQLYSQFNTSEFNKATDEIFFSWDWTDYDDFMRKYGPETNIDAWSFWGSVFEYFHGVSVLVEQRLIDVHLVYELMSGPILRYWEKVEPILKERRKYLSFPDAIDSVDHLAQEMIMIRDKKMASTTKRQ